MDNCKETNIIMIYIKTKINLFECAAYNLDKY